MKIAFRVDANLIIGSGHVMRCLTLAEELKKEHDIYFICSAMEGNLIAHIKGQGYFVETLPIFQIKDNNNSSYKSYVWEEDFVETSKFLQSCKIDCLIVDHYMLDGQWEKAIKSWVAILFVIDDLANRTHCCDVLLDQNFYITERNRYNNLIDTNAMLLLGEKYALLRDEFIFLKKQELNEIKRLFIYFGASDLSNETEKVLKAYKSNKYTFNLTVLLGINNPYKKNIFEKYSVLNNAEILLETKSISNLMREADLSIGAGGSTTWERCCIGLPSIVVIVAQNQDIPMIQLEQKGVIQILRDTSLNGYTEILNTIQSKPLNHWKEMQLRGMNLFDGDGKKRVKKILEGLLQDGHKRAL